MKTSDLTGAALDYAVAKCVGVEFTYEDHPAHELICFKYSTDWSQGGPIIEREGICLWSEGYDWEAKIQTGSGEWLTEWDVSPLIAAMKCYVASKMGEEINIPNEVSST